MVRVAPVTVEEVEERAGEHQEEWQGAEQVRPMFAPEEEPRNCEKAEERESRSQWTRHERGMKCAGVLGSSRLTLSGRRRIVCLHQYHRSWSLRKVRTISPEISLHPLTPLTMDPMMNSLLPPSPLSLAAALFHWIGATLWITGTVLVVTWAIRSLPPERLRAVGLTTFALGVLAGVVAMLSSWSAPYAGMHALSQDQAPLTWYGDGVPGRGESDGQWTMMGGMMRDPRTVQGEPGVRPDASASTTSRPDAAAPSPDHLMPDGSMMDSRSMERATAPESSAGSASRSPSGTAPTNQ